MKAEQFNELKKHVDVRMDEIMRVVRETLKGMEERQKDTLGYLVRSTSKPTK